MLAIGRLADMHVVIMYICKCLAARLETNYGKSPLEKRIGGHAGVKLCCLPVSPAV